MMPDSHLSLLLNDAAKMQNRNRVIRHNALGVKILRNPGHYNNTTSDACRRVFQREIRGYTYVRYVVNVFPSMIPHPDLNNRVMIISAEGA